MRIVVAALAVTLLSVGVDQRPAVACDCPEPPPPLEAHDAVDAVFAGEVVAIDEIGQQPPGPWIDARIRVHEVWKGAVHEVVEVRTHAHGPTCGYGFEPGREELVYAWVDDGRLLTDLCQRTRALDAADEDLAALGAGEPPLAGPQPGVDDADRSSLLVGLAVAGLLLVSLVAVARRRLTPAGHHRT